MFGGINLSQFCDSSVYSFELDPMKVLNDIEVKQAEIGKLEKKGAYQAAFLARQEVTRAEAKETWVKLGKTAQN